MKNSKKLGWWWLGLALFLIFVILQVPASWLFAKFYKNNQNLHNINGNIWSGQADWQRGQLKGSIHWQTRPLDLFLLRAGANIELHSGRSQAQAHVSYGWSKKIVVRHLNGELTADTLKKFADWQWPTSPIQLKDISFDFKSKIGFSKSKGAINWAGGPLVYQYAQLQDRMDIPALNIQLLDEAGKLRLDGRDQRGQKMLNILLDHQGMMDLQLTQRLLINSASYQGKSGLDNYVLSTRQPLLQGGM